MIERKPSSPWVRRGTLLGALALLLVTAYFYWLNHPDDPFELTRLDESLLGAEPCGDPAWADLLIALSFLGLVAAPALLIWGGVREYHRRDWSGAAMIVLAIASAVFVVVTSSFVGNVTSMTACG